MEEKNRIFLVEDDLSFGSVLKSYLEINDFSVQWIDDGKYAVDTFRQNEYDLCILDVMLPHVDGFTIGKEIRTMDERIPILFLTAKTMKDDVLTGYGVGADDYMTKPFDSEVLLAKVQAILKRGGRMDNGRELIRIGNYQFNHKLRTICLGEEERKLSPKESQLLKMLNDYKNNLLGRDVALKKIWGEDDYFTARSMDVYITKLRKYLAGDPAVEIKNVHGSGFQLIVNKPE